MASKSKQKVPSQPTDYQPQTLTVAASIDDDDFMDFPAKRHGYCSEHLKMKPPTSLVRSSKRSKGSTNAILRRNVDSKTLSLIESSPSPSAPKVKRVCLITNDISNQDHDQGQGFGLDDAACGLDSIESSIDCSDRVQRGTNLYDSEIEPESKLKSKLNGSDSSDSMESRLLTSILRSGPNISGNSGSLDEDEFEEFEPGTPLDVLLKLCSEVDERDDEQSNGTDFYHHQECGNDDGNVHCPLCGIDISDMTDELRQVHTNQCLDKDEPPNVLLNGDTGPQCPGQVLDGSPVRSPQQVVDVYPVLEWLHNLGLARYEEVFVQEEIDWNALQRLTDEDLFSMGVTALGPRKKIIHALNELRKEGVSVTDKHADAPKVIDYDTCKLAANKLITDYFPGFAADRKKGCVSSGRQSKIETTASGSSCKQVARKKHFINRKFKDIPLWCCIPGTPFRVDAFKFLRRDCSHWFLTHFHMDHYQGLTRSFCHGKIYCSLITAKLVTMKLGITWDKLQVLPLNQKTSISGIDVTCFDANHCPGSIMILFEPPDGKAVLHTGDFRFSEEMTKMSILPAFPIQNLILDTTYCMPQYDFPKQEAVIQFVIEAIQAEAFNPKTLFLIGSYTIGKERLFLEVARVLRKKVYVTAAKLRLLECLELPKEDMQWLTLNEQESHIHVVPMWTLASFKRLKYLSNQYANRFSLIVAFSPTGWSFGKGKKKTPGRRWQQGTVIRYDVPYSEHSSYTELREFVKFISPVNIIPSVNNYGIESSNEMVSLLLS